MERLERQRDRQRKRERAFNRDIVLTFAFFHSVERSVTLKKNNEKVDITYNMSVCCPDRSLAGKLSGNARCAEVCLHGHLRKGAREGGNLLSR